MSLSDITARELLVADGYLSKSTLGNLVLYNYTDRCTYAKHWIDVTLNSRGIVFDSESGECVARPFPKFFNLDEHESTRIDALPGGDYWVHEKMDGSLGILFQHLGEWRVTTRGSLHSEQGARATQMLSKYRLDTVPSNVTLLFEIIYPSNRIIVPYGEREELVLLGAIHRETGAELPWGSVRRLADECGFSVPACYATSVGALVDARETIPYTEEGWVVRFESGLRVKIKGKDYLRLAKIKATLGPLSIWEAMEAGRIDEYLIQLPEEMRVEAEQLRDVLQQQFDFLYLEASTHAAKLQLRAVAAGDRDAARDAATAIQKQAPSHLHGYLYTVMRGKENLGVLYAQIRPDGNKLRTEEA